MVFSSSGWNLSLQMQECFGREIPHNSCLSPCKSVCFIIPSRRKNCFFSDLQWLSKRNCIAISNLNSPSPGNTPITWNKNRPTIALKTAIKLIAKYWFRSLTATPLLGKWQVAVCCQSLCIICFLQCYLAPLTSEALLHNGVKVTFNTGDVEHYWLAFDQESKFLHSRKWGRGQTFTAAE